MVLCQMDASAQSKRDHLERLRGQSDVGVQHFCDVPGSDSSVSGDSLQDLAWLIFGGSKFS